VTDRQTQDDNIYRASIASRGKNQVLQSNMSDWSQLQGEHSSGSKNKSNKHYCVLSNSGLSNATSKRPKLAFFRGKICPPQSRSCQNRILHISKINFYFGFRWYST